MSPATSATEVRRTVNRAIERIEQYGLDGPRPIEELEALLTIGEAVVPTLIEALQMASPRHVAAAIHLVYLLRFAELAPTIASVAFETAASWEAKREAIAALTACEAEVPASDAERFEKATDFLRQPNSDALGEIMGWPVCWRLPVLLEWLRGDDIDLELVGRALGLGPDTDVPLLEWLGSQPNEEAMRLVRELQVGANDRAVVKAARRALHRLRSLGVDIADSGADDERPFSLAYEPDVVAEAEAHLSGIDGSGTRVLWLLIPSRAGGFRLLEALLDDKEGVRKAEVLAVTRKGFRTHLERLRGSPNLLVGRIDSRRAIESLVAAEALAGSEGLELPASYTKWRGDEGRPLFETVKESEALSPRIYDRLAEQSVSGRPELLDASVKLLDLPVFSTWALVGDPAERAAEQIRRAETSRLMINDAQRKEQVEGALREAASGIDSVARQLYRRRLEAMAWLLWEAGEQEVAERALAAAVGFSEVASLYDDHPFARALIQRGVMVAYSTKQDHASAAEASSRIVLP